MNTFQLCDIYFAYSPQQPILHNISLSIPERRFVAVVGSNGSGKSTLLKLCVGLLRPQSGQVKILNTPIEQFRDWKKIAYISQQSLPDSSFPVTVEEAVQMGRVAAASIGSRLRRGDYAIAAEAIEMVGLYQLRKRMIGQLSGGQQQRVAIARALAAQPQILLLDEATSGVDAEARARIYSLLQGINKTAGTSILIVSHDVEQVLRYADDIVCVDNKITYYRDGTGYHNCPQCWTDRGDRRV